MPNLRSFQEIHPNLLAFKIDFRSHHYPLVSLPCQRHFHVMLPILVAGGAAGRIKGGRHIRYAEATPLANVHLTLLEKAGVRLKEFGDSKEQLAEI